MVVKLCIDCAQPFENNNNRRICNNCTKNRTALKVNNQGWMEIAKEAQLEIWERQPGETDQEYGIWSVYRDMYPTKRPTNRAVARTLGISKDTVNTVAKRWSFTTRMQEWVKHVDSELVSKRRAEIYEMNKEHTDMAKKLNSILAKAIDKLDPEAIGSKDIPTLMRMATELERKARLDQYELVVAENPANASEANDPTIKRASVDTSDIGEIVKILAGAGALDNVGIRQTVTTEVVKKGEQD